VRVHVFRKATAIFDKSRLKLVTAVNIFLEIEIRHATYFGERITVAVA